MSAIAPLSLSTFARSRLHLLLFVILAILPFSSTADTLSPFTSDGCSVFPDGRFSEQNLWLDCCIAHDLAYWKGGSYQQRREADYELEQCVQRVGEPDIARVMLAGVRVGGSPYWLTPYRWGYGWSYGRGYQPLNNEEKQQVRQRLLQLKQQIEVLTKQLDETLD